MPVKDQQCKTCFYSRPANVKVIICQRYPPTVLKVEGTEVTSTFPLLREDGWCGEWRRKPVK